MSLTELPDAPPPPFRKRKRPRTVPVLAFLLGGFCLLLSGAPFLVLLFWILAIPAIFMGFVALTDRYPMRWLGVVGALLAMVSLGAGLSSTIGSFNEDGGQQPSYNAAAGANATPSSDAIADTSTSEPVVPVAPAPVTTPEPVAPAPVTTPEPVAPVAPVIPVVPAAPEATEPDTGGSGGEVYTPPQQDDSYVFYKNCDAVRAAGKDPLHRGEPGYASHLDRDGDGIACE